MKYLAALLLLLMREAALPYLPGPSRLVIYQHPSSLEQILTGEARADFMDNFEARLLRSRVDVALEQHDLAAAQAACAAAGTIGAKTLCLDAANFALSMGSYGYDSTSHPKHFFKPFITDL